MARDRARLAACGSVVISLFGFAACAEDPTGPEVVDLGRIIWETGRDGNKALYLMKPDGSEVRRLTGRASCSTRTGTGTGRST